MRFFKTHVALLIWRIIFLYVVLMLCRLLFYAYNSTLMGEIPFSEWWSLVCGSFKFDTVSILYTNAIFIILSLIPLRIRERSWWCRMKFWYYVIANSLLIVVTNLADAIYFHYTQKRFTADEIFFAENDNSAMLVLKFAAENWYMVLVGIAFIIMLAAGYWRKTRERSMLQGVWYYIGSTLVFIAAIGFSIGGVRGGFTKMTRPITMSNATLYTADNMRATMILSNPFCILRTVGSSGKISYQKYYSEEELDSIYSPKHYPAEKLSQAELEGRNVVVFVMESFSAEHSALLRPDLYQDKKQKGYTPVLDSLMRHSYTFYNMYANGRRSIQALPAVWASIPSYKNPFVLMPQAMAQTRALPAILKDKGYRTMFFCGSDHGSMGFGAFARTTGIEHLYSRQDYEKTYGKDDFDGYWGIWDEKFIGYMGEQLQQSKEPFFATIFTLTSHHPFVIPEEYEGRLPEGLTPNHKCVAYVDQAIGKFFARYQDQEWFRNTIFVFVADHVSSEQFSDEFRSAPGSYQIIGFMHAPESSLMGVHHQVVSQVDIMPTLLGLLGNEEPYFAFGRDIFNEHDAMPMSVSYANNMFQAITTNHLILFDEKQVIAVYANDDYKHEHNLLGQVDVSSIEKRLKAMIQSYYSHIEAKNYVIQDN